MIYQNIYLLKGKLTSNSSDETEHIDHLVFVVHGIGSVGDLKFRSFVDCGKCVMLFHVLCSISLDK